MMEEDEVQTQDERERDLPWRDVLVCANRREGLHGVESVQEAYRAHGIEAWADALGAHVRHGHSLRHDDLVERDLILLSLDYPLLSYYDEILSNAPERDAPVVGVYTGALEHLHPYAQSWKKVADKCDLVISVNGYGTGYLQSLTTSPVSFVGVPYSVGSKLDRRIPVERRQRRAILCGWLLDRSTDYLAVRSLGLPMVGFERSTRKSVRGGLRGRRKERMRWVDRARELYDDELLSVLLLPGYDEYLDIVSDALLWVDLDPRYTSASSVVDGAALGIPVISTAATWHGPYLFPDLVVESPFDVAGAGRMAERLLSDSSFYGSVVAGASKKLAHYRQSSAIQRLSSALNGDAQDENQLGHGASDFRQEWH